MLVCFRDNIRLILSFQPFADEAKNLNLFDLRFSVDEITQDNIIKPEELITR
jgi:hypothetical protein